MINGKEAPSYLKHANAYGVEADVKTGQEVPAQKWVDVNDGKVGIALLNKTKYGHSYANGNLRITLMRTAGDPDIYPNLGKFNISYALYPHTGDWQNGVWAEGDNFNVPNYAAEPPSLALAKAHSTRPEEASFFSVDAPGVILSGMKQAEEGNELIVRLAEVFGKETTVNLKLPVDVSAARRLNIIEFPLENVANPLVSGKSIQIKIRANEIVTLGITPVK
jgi:alpha-mannosidase